MRSFFITTAFFLIATIGQTQSADLKASGVVYGGGGLPLSGASLALLMDGNPLSESSTKPNGLFSYKLDFDHTYLLTVSKDGYQPQQVRFDMEDLTEEEKRFTYKLTRIRLTLKEVSTDAEPVLIQDFTFDRERGNFVNQL